MLTDLLGGIIFKFVMLAYQLGNSCVAQFWIVAFFQIEKVSQTKVPLEIPGRVAPACASILSAPKKHIGQYVQQHVAQNPVLRIKIEELSCQVKRP